MGKYLLANNVYCGRSEDLMKLIEPNSVSLSFWSPPYFVGKEYEINETYFCRRFSCRFLFLPISSDFACIPRLPRSP